MDVPGRIDNTVLGPATTSDQVLTCLDEAIEYGTNARLPPCYVELAGSYAPETTIVTVVGFPYGYHATTVKVAEAEQAYQDGADELSLVANVGRLKAGEDDQFRDDIAEVVASVPLPVTVVVNAPLLTDAELDRACQLAVEADADMVETATGGVDGGATVAAVERMGRFLPVVASGGVETWDRAKALLDAGAERVGTHTAPTIVEEWQAATPGDP